LVIHWTDPDTIYGHLEHLVVGLRNSSVALAKL
jgi:hypothetical protein